jgi:hypothetical protein
MPSGTRVIAVVLSLGLAAPGGVSAADCGAVLQQVQADAAAFQAEAERQGVKSVADAALDPALKSAKRALVEAGGEEAERLEKLADAKDLLKSWSERVAGTQVFLFELNACLHGGPAGCLSQLIATVNAENRAYVQALAGENAADAAARVDKAASFLNDYVSRLNGSATGSIAAAASCLQGPIDAAHHADGGGDTLGGRRTPAPAPPAPSAPTVEPKRGGHGIGPVLVVGAVVAAGLAVAASKAKSGGKCDAGFSFCQNPGGGGADKCCPTASPYYCAADNGCRSDPFFSCSSGKIFCSTEN